MSLTGVAVLLVLEPESAADAEQRGLRQRVVAAGGQCSINGDPPLPAYALSHIVSSSWDTMRRHAPSLARRHIGSEQSPPKRQKLLESRSGLTDRCCLVTPKWLQATLIAGRPQPESEFQMPPTAGAACMLATQTEGISSAAGHSREL